MSSVEEEDEGNFAEDECTIEFGEEEPPPPPAAASTSTGGAYPAPAPAGVVGGPRFVEYPGEDFAKYLTDAQLTTIDYNNDQDQVCNH